jgi:hypothetical protein
MAYTLILKVREVPLISLLKQRQNVTSMLVMVHATASPFSPWQNLVLFNSTKYLSTKYQGSMK